MSPIHLDTFASIDDLIKYMNERYENDWIENDNWDKYFYGSFYIEELERNMAFVCSGYGIRLDPNTDKLYDYYHSIENHKDYDRYNIRLT